MYIDVNADNALFEATIIMKAVNFIPLEE